MQIRFDFSRHALLLANLLANLLISIYVFSNGFLLRRLALNATNYEHHENLQQFDKALVLFIDALRYDFVFTNSSSPVNGLKTIEMLIHDQPAHAKLFKFISDPPTTTMQRIKGLMSGTLPTFIDAGANFNSYVIEEDNLIRQCAANNKSVVFMGDDTWMSLFEESMFTKTYPYPSFNVKDIDTVDRNVNEKLMAILNEEIRIDWKFLIAHYLGVDHVGHTYGSKHQVMKRKLGEVDDTIQKVVKLMDEQTLLLVFGDHGMTDMGDHGGDSEPEVETLLFLYSKKEVFDASRTKISTAKQIDLTPSLALLIGIPIPFSNLGIVIPELFRNKESEAIHANYLQLKNFIIEYQYNSKYEESINVDDLKESYGHLESIQQFYRQKWSNFNMIYCVIGIGAFVATLIFTLALMCYVKEYDSNTRNGHIVSFSIREASTVSVGMSLVVFVVNGFNFELMLSCYVISFLVYLLVRHMKLLSQLVAILPDRYLLIYSLTLFIPFSNSFVIHENVCLRHFMLASLILLCSENKIGHWRLLLVLALCRLSEVFYICREETQETCKRTSFSMPISKLVSSDGAVFYVLLSLGVVCLTYFMFFDKTIKQRVVRMMLKLQMVILAFYWFLQLYNFNTTLLLLLPRIYYFLFLFEFLYLCYNAGGGDMATLIAIVFQLLVILLGENRSISICMLVAVLNIVKVENKSIDKTLVPFVLLQQYFFYATGHENTFTNIRWEVVFHGFEGDSGNVLIRVISTVFLLSSTYSSAIIVFLHLISTLNKGTKTKSNLKYQLIVKYIILVSLKMCVCMCAAFLLRRHLMVWKIFAPRFIFEALGYITLSCVMTLAILLLK